MSPFLDADMKRFPFSSILIPDQLPYNRAFTTIIFKELDVM
jgi:hypothetical protein